MMTTRSDKTAVIFASFLGTIAALPIAATHADTSPNAVNNATVDDRCNNPLAGSGSTGTYDNFDSFKDSTGRPCPGWEYLFYSPN
jgi:hypothetical protein